MAEQETGKNQYIKKETTYFIAFLCLVIGFLGGIVFSVYKSPSVPSQTVTPAPQQSAQGISAEDAQKMVTLEREVAKNPNNVDAWTQLGHVYFDSNQFEKAINAYNKSLALRPNNADILTDLGVMYRRNGNPQQAIASFDKAVAVNPKHETSRFNKGVVLMYDLQDRAGAIKVWEELVSVNPLATAPTGEPLKNIIEKMQAEAK